MANGVRPLHGPRLAMVTYGKGWPCVRCNGMDDAAHTISSGREVESVGADLADRLRPICQDRGRMLGVMQTDGKWIVTLSSAGAVRWEFVRAVMELGSRFIPLAHDWSTV